MNKRMMMFLLSAFLPLSSFGAEAQLNPATSWGDALIRVQRGRGHPGDKMTILSGDIINGLSGRGYNGTNFTTSDGISLEFQASETWTSTANGSKMLFKVTPDTTATAATIMTITGTGVSVAGNISSSLGLVGLYVSTAPRSALAVAALTISAGSMIWNSTDGQICIATAAVQTSFVLSSTGSLAPAIACSH